MSRFLDELKDFWKKGDIFLLILCLIVSGFGCVFIASATSADKFGGNLKYIIIQLAATGLGVMMYALVSSIDLDFLSEHRMVMVAFNCALLLMLISPLGTDHDSGNRSWIDLGFISVQPAEICKITYVVIMASVMSAHQNRISSLPSIMHMCLHLGLLVGLNMVLSGDAGVSLIFVFIFIGMAFGGGVSLWWFVLAIGLIVAAFPILWQFLGEYQQNRFLILVDDTIDPMGINERYHSMMNLRSLTGGGLTGQGLFNGNRTQSGSLFAGHTDYIFSSMGEELGFVGAVIVILLFVLFLVQGLWLAFHAENRYCTLVGIGIMAQIAWQVFCNIAVVTNTLPNTGISLPFFSSGGTSLILLLAEMGVMVNIGRNGERVRQERRRAHEEQEARRKEKTIDLASARKARAES